MKKIFLLISILYSVSNLAQNPDPELFQTWYLDSVQSSDASPAYQISEIEPTVTPTLIILENLTFSGQGACNSFNGTFNIPSASAIETTVFTNSVEECTIPLHNSFEDSYFEFLQSIVYYEIITDGDDLLLHIGSSVFGQAVFKNTLLNTTDFNLKKISIYPNPTNSVVFINSLDYTITKIELLNSYTQSIKTIKNNFERIDISNLPFGVYLMRIYTEHGVMNKKIIKS